MSPLDHGETCYFIIQKEVPDGQGGWTTDWGEGDSFVALIDFSTSSTAKIAEAFGVTSLYTVMVDKDLAINIGDLFATWDERERLYYGYRVTSRPDDQKAPEDSNLDFKVLSAENYTLPEHLSELRPEEVAVVDGHLNIPQRLSR